MIKRAIIFDLDGTLWDACQAIADSWNDYLQKYAPHIKVTITEQMIRSVCGLTMKAIGDHIFAGVENPERDELTEGCCEHEVECLRTAGGTPYPDLEEVLRELTGAGYLLFIVSNCQKGYIESFLEWTKTGQYFSDIECFGNTGMEKDENIRLLLDRHPMTEALYLGDTIGDQRSAKQAGLPFIHAAYGFGTVDEKVPAIDSLKELLPAAKKVFEKMS